MTIRKHRPPRVPMRRRLVVGTAWALAWMVAWAGALVLFSNRVQAAPLVLAVSEGPVSLPVHVAEARGLFGAEGLDVRLRDCRSGRECYALMSTIDPAPLRQAASGAVGLVR